MSTRNHPGGIGRVVCKADNLTAICEPIVQKMWEPRSLTTLWASTACYTDRFTFLPFIVRIIRNMNIVCARNAESFNVTKQVYMH
jgi:hypothetical protein